MPRSVTISLPSDRASVLVDDLATVDGILTVSRQRAAPVRRARPRASRPEPPA